MAKVAEHLPSKKEALDSIPYNAKQTDRQKNLHKFNSRKSSQRL
jgi:hypothetical protein